jgi:pyruvate,water dikinase
MRYSRSLSDLRRADESDFGAKSASLGELLAARIPVPDGFALGTDAYRAFVAQAGLAPLIERRLQALEPDDMQSVRSACGEIVAAFGRAPVPEEVKREIADGYQQLAPDTDGVQPALAVRSSALGEDSHTATFAGQQETFLWVRGVAGVTAAVRDCWASLYSPTAVSYRARAASEHHEPAMGVAIQVMVDAAISGVMFTCNPVTGDPSTIAINASWGLGEAVVAGEVTPDEYLLSKVTGELLRERIGAKLIEHVPSAQGTGTTVQDVAPERRDVPCLSADDHRTLVDLAGRIERHFGGHQDVEWAIARGQTASDGLFVVQSRPVTTAPRPDPKPKPTSAIELVMSAFGAGPKPRER